MMINDPGGAGVFPDGSIGISAVGAERSDLIVTDVSEPVLVRQEFQEEADINVIMARFGADVVRAFGTKKAMYGDFTGLESYDDALAKVEEAEAKFMRLPWEFRERFQNDPGVFLEKVKDLSEEEFAALVEPPKSEPVPAPVVPPA